MSHGPQHESLSCESAAMTSNRQGDDTLSSHVRNRAPKSLQALACSGLAGFWVSFFIPSSLNVSHTRLPGTTAIDDKASHFLISPSGSGDPSGLEMENRRRKDESVACPRAGTGLRRATVGT